MKSRLFLLPSLLFFIGYAYAQNYDYVNTDNGITRGSSIKEKNSFQIPLYNISLEGTSIPIFLSYNSKGMKVSNLPNSVGFNWSLHAGGEIQRQINHLVDENEEGWLFNDNFGDYLTGNFYGANKWIGKNLFETVDATPDFFNMKISNGDYLNYFYKRGSTIPIITNQNGSFNESSVYTNLDLLKQFEFEDNQMLYQSDNDADFVFTNKAGINYLFRKGTKRVIPFDAKRIGIAKDSSEYRNYYLHKVTSQKNQDYVDFQYITTKINKFTKHVKATRRQTNSNTNTYPEPSDPIVTEGYYEDISVQDVSRKEIKKIITSNETIEFIYKEGFYQTDFLEPLSQGNVLFDLQSQSINLLEEIKISDHNGNYISGYKFLYTETSQDPNLEQGTLKIKQILKYGKNHKSFIVFKEFDYYPIPGDHVSAISPAQDVFGYSNGAYNNGQCQEKLVINSQCFDNLPAETYLITGMIKSIVNEKGGKTEYTYKENSSGISYYGGLLISSVIDYDEENNLVSKIEYEYEEPEGFGLPVYEQLGQGETPVNTYVDGYFDDQVMYNSWYTFFSKKDSKMKYLNLQYLTAYNTSNIPYALQKTGSVVEGHIQNLQLQNYSQQKRGAFYKKVTQTKINVTTDQSEKGYIIKHYGPSLSGFVLNKKLEKVEYYNFSDVKIKEELFNYELVDRGENIDAFKFNNVHLQSNISSPDLYRYVIEDFTIYQIVNVLKSREIKEYDTTGNLLKNYKSTYSYLNESSSFADYYSIKEKLDYYNGLLYKKTNRKYLKEYNNIEHLASLTDLNPVIESNEWLISNSRWKLSSSTTSSFSPSGKIEKMSVITNNKNSGDFYYENNFTPSYFDATTEELISEDTDNIVEFVYDLSGKLTAKKDLNKSINEIYQRSDEYNGLYIDAVLSTTMPYNSESNFFLKKSFENISENGVVKFDKAFSGNNVYGGASIFLGDFPSDYQVSFWSYELGKWEYNSLIHSGGNLTINKPLNATYIDEIIIKPPKSSITTFTHIPLIGTTSTLNERGDGERIEYGLFRKPLFILDRDNQVLKEYRYNNINH